MGGKLGCVVEQTASGPVGSDEIGVTELAESACPVFFSAGPQVASREPAEDRSPTGVGPLTLQAGEDLFYGVRHCVSAATSAGSLMPAWANPRARNRQLSQRPHGYPSGVGP